jgi:hypothetical protein
MRQKMSLLGANQVAGMQRKHSFSRRAGSWNSKAVAVLGMG